MALWVGGRGAPGGRKNHIASKDLATRVLAVHARRPLVAPHAPPPRSMSSTARGRRASTSAEPRQPRESAAQAGARRSAHESSALPTDVIRWAQWEKQFGYKRLDELEAAQMSGDAAGVQEIQRQIIADHGRRCEKCDHLHGDPAAPCGHFPWRPSGRPRDCAAGRCSSRCCAASSPPAARSRAVAGPRSRAATRPAALWLPSAMADGLARPRTAGCCAASRAAACRAGGGLAPRVGRPAAGTQRAWAARHGTRWLVPRATEPEL